MAPDSRYSDMLAAGERLLVAMKAEEEFSALYRKKRNPEMLANWAKARAAIDEQSKRYREARLSCGEDHDSRNRTMEPVYGN
jgi:hypothetical protein